jgi:hypothetical protein
MYSERTPCWIKQLDSDHQRPLSRNRPTTVARIVIPKPFVVGMKFNFMFTDRAIALISEYHSKFSLDLASRPNSSNRDLMDNLRDATNISQSRGPPTEVNSDVTTRTLSDLTRIVSV